MTVAIFYIQLIILLFILYDIVFSVIGVAAKETETLDDIQEPTHKFALLVCAHNEENVIGQIVQCLMKLDYPRHMYDVYVIADNCTDSTTDIARMHGAIPLIRFDSLHKSKGYGLEWAFEQLWKFEKHDITYDAVAIFDADNLVSSNFLKVMDNKLHKYEVVQGYLDTKNPRDSWVTKSFAYSYWLSSRSLQLSRMNMGLSNQLGGTGVVIKTNVLKELGWGTTSLTEDLEFTTRYILNTGKIVGWAHEAKIYDEKPTSFNASWNQRMRWTIGHIDVCLRYSLLIIKQMFILFDCLMYLLQPFKVLFVSLTLVASIISLVFFKLPDYLSHYILGLSILLYVVFPVLTLIKEKRAYAIKWIPLAWWFSLSWIPLIVKAFFRRNEKVWHHTKHGRTVDEDEIKRMVS